MSDLSTLTSGPFDGSGMAPADRVVFRNASAEYHHGYMRALRRPHTGRDVAFYLERNYWRSLILDEDECHYARGYVDGLAGLENRGDA
jgi:hypothetical protein